MRRASCLLVLTALGASSGIAASLRAPTESWGKAGVSLAQYRQDSLECGRQGYYLDIAQTDDAKAFVRASKQLEAIPTAGLAVNTTGASGTGPGSNDSVDQAVSFAGTQQHIIEGVRPHERMQDLKQLLQATVDRCLAGRGYSKFRLTDDQRRDLRRLKIGSDERREYLYRLASNPAVLQSQRVAGQP